MAASRGPGRNSFPHAAAIPVDYLSMKTYQSIPIEECDEPLVDIPAQAFCFTQPHAYVALGAPYAGTSPWMFRQGVLDALLRAQDELDKLRPGWRLKLFDAFRPLAVQAFMVWREFCSQAELAGKSLISCRDPDQLKERDPGLDGVLAANVFEFWGVPSDDPRTPPPHSTGAAVDLTLLDASGNEAAMGCPIDEMTERAYPDHFANAISPQLREYHLNRVLLHQAMTAAGFSRHGNEWWHFSCGDQMWAWARGKPAAIYGRAA